MADYRTPVGPVEKLQMTLLRLQKIPAAGTVARMALKAWGVTIPPSTYTEVPYLAHVGSIVVHERTRIGKNVVLFQNVTIGRADIWRESHQDFQGFIVEDGAVLCAGATVVSGRGTLTIGAGSIIGANSVLTQSTGRNEVWAGNPARLVRKLAD